MDYAESTLACSKVYCMVSLSIPDEERKAILKSFRFMDFQTLPPGVPLTCSGYIFTSYNIDSSSSSDSNSSSDEQDND